MTTDIAFVGYGVPLTKRQEEVIAFVLKQYNPAIVRHTDFKDSCKDFHNLIREKFPNCRIIIHPHDQKADRVNCQGDEILEPKSWDVCHREMLSLSNTCFHPARFPIKTKKGQTQGDWIRKLLFEDNPYPEDFWLIGPDGDMTLDQGPFSRLNLPQG